jgi:hypothetical protein
MSIDHLYPLLAANHPPLGTVAAFSGLARLGFVLFLFLGPFALLPSILQRWGGIAGSAMGGIGNVLNGAKGANLGWRKGMRKNKTAEVMENRRKSLGVGSAMNRFKYADKGGLSPFGKGRARYQAALTGDLQRTAGKMVEQDGGRSGGDDDAMAIIARRGMTGSRFRSEYSQLLQSRGMGAADANRRAREAQGMFEANFGSTIGTGAARVAAFKASMGSNTSFGQENYDTEIATLGAQLINDGLMSSVDAAAAVKSNKLRGDRSGVGFSTWLNTLNEAAANDRRGGNRPIISDATRRNVRQDAVGGMDIGQMMGGRHETVRLLAPTVYQNLQDAVAGNDYLGFDPGANATAEQHAQAQNSAMQKALANVAAMQDIAGQVSGLKNDHNIRAMNAAMVTLPGVNYQVTAAEAVQYMREGAAPVRDADGQPVYDAVQGPPDEHGNPTIQRVQRTVQLDNREFNARRREYQQGTAAAAAAAAGRPPDAPPGAPLAA